MKKYIYIVLAVATLAACSREEKDLFDQSASERVEAAQNKLSETLCSSSNGWEMLYFPTPEAAGYAFLMKFTTDGAVKIAAKNSVTTSTLYKEETSAWGTDGTQGPALCFTTYNTIFHKFANPGSDGLGYQGDYEFVCLNAAQDQISLKGKKSGAYVIMNRLPAEQDWKNYFRDVDDIYEAAFLGNDGVDMTYHYGDSIMSMVYKDGVFTYKNGEVEIGRGFIVTPSGVHFYTGVPFCGDTTKFVKDFVVTDDRIQAKGEELNEYYFLSNRNAADFFTYKFEKKNRWTYTEELSDEATKSAFNALYNTASSKGAKIQSIAYERYTITISNNKTSTINSLHVNYLVEGKLFEGEINLTFSKKDNQITYTYKGYDNSIVALLQRINATDSDDAAKQIAAIFCGTFTPETAGSELNMNKMYLKDGNRTIGVTIDYQIH